MMDNRARRLVNYCTMEEKVPPFAKQNASDVRKRCKDASASSVLEEPMADTSESLIVISGDLHNDIETTVTADWSQYTPSMMWGAIHPGLRAPSPCQIDAGQEKQQPPSPTPLPGLSATPDTVATPRVQHRALSSTSRRRPTLRDRTEQNLSAQRIETLTLANTQAAEEHEIKMRILRLQEEKEKEILKQERLKTRQDELKLEILELKLRDK